MSAHPPVARVCIDSPLPHLDRPFDYAIPDALAGAIEPGSRVRVPFAGRLVSGVVVETVASTEFEGKLAAVKSAGATPSFNTQGLGLAHAIARRYGGSLWDVARLMAPPRVAALEKRDWTEAPDIWDYAAAADELAGSWADYEGNPLAGLGSGARVVWEALPERGTSPLPARALLAAAARTAAGGASAIVVVPDLRALEVLTAVAAEAGLQLWTSRKPGPVARVHATDKPSPRYGSYLAAMHGHARIVIGTRPAAMANVPNLGLIAVWDDGNSGYEERHAPYPHARTIAAMRAEREGAALLVGGFAQTAAARALVEHGWATAAAADRTTVRAGTPAVTVWGDEERDREGGAGWHWMPGRAWSRALTALDDGPVLVLVPRAGYVRAAACAQCREWARCRACEGPLELPAPGGDPACRDCGTVNADWHCPECNGERIAAVRIGVERVAEELTAMSRGVAVHVSAGATGPLDDGAVVAGIVVATPAAIPAVAGGYAHAVLVDAIALVGQGADGEEDAVRMILNSLAHVRPRASQGAATVVGHLPAAVARAVSSWAPADAATDFYAERAALGFPPHRRVVEVSGTQAEVDAALTVKADGHALTAHPEVSVSRRPSGVATLLCGRGAAQLVVDALRAHQREQSERGGGTMRLRVDGALEVG